MRGDGELTPLLLAQAVLVRGDRLARHGGVEVGDPGRVEHVFEYITRWLLGRHFPLACKGKNLSERSGLRADPKERPDLVGSSQVAADHDPSVRATTAQPRVLDGRRDVPLVEAGQRPARWDDLVDPVEHVIAQRDVGSTEL